MSVESSHSLQALQCFPERLELPPDESPGSSSNMSDITCGLLPSRIGEIADLDTSVVRPCDSTDHTGVKAASTTQPDPSVRLPPNGPEHCQQGLPVERAGGSACRAGEI